MSTTVIKVENISKRYRIGVRSKAETLAEQVKNILLYPIHNFKRISGLTKFSEEDESVFWALRDINFEVKHGEVLGIIGHNGAGKSTLLKILSRITEPTTGSIEIRGRVSSLLEVGTGFHPELTGRDNVYMNGTILGMRKHEIDQKFDEIVSFSGVEKHIDTPVKFYSSGMKVRLAFSVAAHLEPEILIIDEVLAVGDAEFQAKCLGKMEDVAGKGRTVLFVSHNMIAVENLCTRVLLLQNGKIIENGKPREVTNSYLGIGRKDFTQGEFQPILLEKGDMIFKVNKFAVLPPLGSFQLRSGDDATIIFDFENIGSENLNKLNFALHIKDGSNQSLFSLSPGFLGEEYNSSKQKCLIKCRVPRLQLVENTYFVSLWLKINNSTVFTVNEIAKFNVVNGDYFSSGKLPKKARNTVFYVDHSWEYVE